MAIKASRALQKSSRACQPVLALYSALGGLLTAVAVLGGCAPKAHPDQQEEQLQQPLSALFDPTQKIVPFPNDLLLNPSTGLVNVPPQCGESTTAAAVRENEVNQLNGFGTWRPALQTSFSAPVDPESLGNRVFLLRMATLDTIVTPGSEEPIPVAIVPGTTTAFDASCTPRQVANITIIPKAPLAENTTYAVVLRSGITAAGGTPLLPSATWGFVRQEEAPATLALTPDGGARVVVNRTPFDPTDPQGRQNIIGLTQLWQADAPLLQFTTAALGAFDAGGAPATPVSRSDILLAWSFTTQTVTVPLDPTTAGTPAATVAEATPNSMRLVLNVTEPAAIENTIDTAVAALGGGANACAAFALPCGAVGSILSGTITTTDFQTPTPTRVPGPWSKPLAPATVDDVELAFIALTPRAAAPSGGRPTIVFGHGLASSKESLFAIASQLAAAGFNSIAIDWVAHGSRAVQISTDEALGCAGSPSPTTAPQCFAPIFSSDLAATRDSLRQSALDAQKLIEVVKTCGPEACESFSVDPARIGYLGQSLGSIIGGLVVATSPDVGVAVLNTVGVSLTDIIFGSPSESLRCPAVDALIDAGFVSGDKWSFGANTTTAACLTSDFTLQPGFQTFASTARWVWDPADPVNYIGRLRPKKELIQEVVGDEVIPNATTEILAGFLGLTPVDAATGAPPQPSGGAGSGARSTTSAWIRYTSDAAAGDVYSHASLLRPVSADGTPSAAGLLGTAQMQLDAITFLGTNL